MEMCPYCGEEVPDESVKCWKCGAILQEVDEETAEAMAEEAEAKAMGPKLVPCPHCESPQAPGTHRCKECGRVIAEWEEGESDDKWKYGSWIAFGGIGALIFLILVIAVATSEVSEKRNYLKKGSWSSVSRRYSAAYMKQNKTKAEKTWESEDEGRYVRWSGLVVSIDGDEVEFAMSPKARKAKKAEVKVSFSSKADDFVGSLAKGKVVGYDAKLVAHNEDGYLFILERGMPIKRQ